MNTIITSLSPGQFRAVFWRTVHGLISLIVVLAALPAASAATVTATYNSAADVPVTSAGYTATGNTVNFTLNFAPEVGTQLTVVENTGVGFISGAFSNLTNGQTVALSYNGTNYVFVANYYGGSGNDLVLVWKSNRAYAWGKNTNGQLGDNSTTQRNAPVSVLNTGVLSGKTIVALAAGGSHSLALCSDGTLAAWGLNSAGQLGDGTLTARSVPVAVSNTVNSALAGKTVVAIAASGVHSLALCSDGTVAAWGGNTFGQLGDGTTTQRTAPVAVSNTVNSALAGKTVVAISAGSLGNFAQSLALCSDGTVVAWGYNNTGQLGDGTTTQRNAPVAVSNTVNSALAGKTVTAIAAGDSHSLALCSDGTLAAWGANSAGQLGDGTTTQRNAPVAVSNTVNSALAGKTVTAIAAGSTVSLALCLDGTVQAWGVDNNGQLGDGAGSSQSVPVAVNTNSGTSALFGKSVSSIASGAGHTVVLNTDGTVAAWGLGTSGQLGNNTTTTTNAAALVDGSNLAAGERFAMLFRNSASTHSLAVVGMPPHAPTDISLSASSLNENLASGTTVGTLTATDQDTGDTATFTLVSGTGDTDNGSFSISGSSLKTAAVFDYEAQSSYSIRVQVTDSSALTYEKQFTISVNNVNDAPTDISLSASSVNENLASGTTVGTLASTDQDAGDTATFTLVSGTGSTDNGSFSITGTALKTAAVFDYETKSSYSIRVRVTDSGSLTFEKQFTISVTDVNEAPTLNALTSVTISEDPGLQTVSLGGISAGSGENQTLSVTAASSNTGLIPNPSITYSSPATTGNLTYTPAANASGTATITVTVTDNGGTANGGVNTISRTFSVTVTAVNDPPTLDAITSLTILEDAGAQSVSLAGITSGPSDESGQTLLVTATSSDTSVIPNPSVTYTSANTTGSISFTPMANANGTVTISVKVSDNGGTASGGVNAVTNTFTVVVTAVNDAPSFTKGADQHPLQNSGLHTVANWATSISAGPSNESGQNVDFIVSNNNNALFAVQPAISAAGTLTYTMATDSTGAATVTVQIHDDGGTANGGANTSASQTFSIFTPSRYGSAAAVSSGAGASALSLADFDGDGYNDIFVGNSTAGTVTLLLNDGTGNFIAITNLAVGSGPAAVGLGDFNSDGRRDLAVANFNDNNVGIFLSRISFFGWGFNVPTPATVSVGDGPTALTVFDGNSINNDGRMDIAVANYNDNTVSILLGGGDGTFTSAFDSPLAVGNHPSAIAKGDFNKDGNVDIAVACAGDNTVRVYLGAGDGTFTEAAESPISVGGNPRGIAALDFNKDGKIDLAVANSDDNNVTLLLGVGDGTFTSASPSTVSVGTMPVDVVLVDLDGDSKPDLITANKGSDTVTVRLGNGDGTFGNPEHYAVGSQPSAVAARALSGSLPTIVTANSGDGTVSILANIVPVAFGKSISLVEDSSVTIGLSGTGTGTLSYVLKTAPTNGVLLTNSVVIPTNLYPVTLGTGVSTVTYRPNTNYAGGDKFTFAVNNGGVDSASANVTINVLAINEAPSFTLNSGLLSPLAEDYPSLVSITNFVTDIVAGGGAETNQIVTFYTIVTNTEFFLNKPVISRSGVLTFKPAKNSNGVEYVSVYAKDNGGTLNGGVNTSSTQTFAITITAVDDRPTISTIAARIGREDVATNISFTIGDVDDDVNSLSVTAVSSNTDLVPDSNLLLGGSGTNRTLLVTPVANSNGFTSITITVDDGTLSTQRVFKVTFNPVNDAPTFTMAGANATVARNSGKTTNAAWITASSPGPDDEASQTIKYTLTNYNTALFSLPPGITNGNLILRGATNAIGSTTISVIAKDSGNTLLGGVNSSTQTMTITLTWRSGDLIVADRGPAGVGTSVYGGTTAGTIFAVNTNTGAQTVITTNFYDPIALAFATNGDLIVVDYDAIPDDPINSRGAVYRISKSTLVRTLVSSGADFAEPCGVAVEANNTILVADSDAFSNLGAVFRVSPTSGLKTLLASNFTYLSGIAVSSGGNIYVTDQGAAKVYQINSVTGAKTQITTGNNLSAPVGLAVEPVTGDLILVDKTSKKLVRVTTGGVQTVISSDAHFVEPTHVAIADNGDFFVTDGKAGSTQAERRIYRVNKTSGVATIISSGNTSGAMIDQPRGLGLVP